MPMRSRRACSPVPIPLNPPGSQGWVLNQRLTSNKSANHSDPQEYWNNLSVDEQEKLTKILRTMCGPNIENRNNKELSESITNWVMGNGWTMIKGGEHNNKWTHPKYPSAVFETGRFYYIQENKFIYFPLGNSLNDPHGLSCSYETWAGGIYASIRPNKWLKMTDTRYYRRVRKRKHNISHKKHLIKMGIDPKE